MAVVSLQKSPLQVTGDARLINMHPGFVPCRIGSLQSRKASPRKNLSCPVAVLQGVAMLKVCVVSETDVQSQTLSGMFAE
jgi:hypothetical protein